MAELPERTIYIGRPSSDGYILLNCGENPGIYYYETWSVFEREEDDINTFKLADDFIGFLNMIEEAIEDDD